MLGERELQTLCVVQGCNSKGSFIFEQISLRTCLIFLHRKEGILVNLSSRRFLFKIQLCFQTHDDWDILCIHTMTVK